MSFLLSLMHLQQQQPSIMYIFPEINVSN